MNEVGVIMRRERSSIAQDLAVQLWEAERKNDLAMASTARLIATALDARLEMRAAACVAHEALEAMTAAISQQATSRRLLIEAHEALNEAKHVVGLGDEDFGGGGDKQVPLTGEILQMPVRRAA
jgi:hypothetical protein